MTFLFGIFFPSYQAYAKGNNDIIAMEKMQLNTKLNNQLVDKLIASNDFENFYNNMALITFNSSILMSTKSEQEIQEFTKKVNELSLTSDSNKLKFKKTFELIGFTSEVSTTISNLISNLTNKLKTSIPELQLLDENGFKSILEQAVVKGKMDQKATKFIFDDAAKDACYDTASRIFGECTSNGSWFKGAMVAGIVICLIGCITACVLVAFGTGGAGVIAFATAMTGWIGGCGVLVHEFFGIIGTNSDNCTNEYNARVSACASQYGMIPPGGAD